MVARLNVEEDMPLTLKEAAELCLRGLVTERSLRDAARRGDLVVEKLGRSVCVTPAEIRRWRERCRSDVKVPDSGSSQRTAESGLSTSLKTTDMSKARDAALTIFGAQSEPSPSTSRKSTPGKQQSHDEGRQKKHPSQTFSPSTGETVVPLSQGQKS
ncbi:MAG: helix-turn-helix domain-containing protein [Devosia sp.]